MNKHTPLMSAHNHYSLRKMSIGLVSVLLGTSLYLGVSQSNAQAATAPAANAAEISTIKTDYASKAKVSINSALDKQAVSADEAINQAKADRASTTGSTSSLTSKKADQPDLAAAKPAPAPKSEGKGTTEENKADTDKQASNKQKTDQSTVLNLKDQKSAKLSAKEVSTSAKKEKGLKPKLLKSEADPTENGLKLRQQTPDGKASLAWTYTDSTGAEHTGHNMLGYHDQGHPITLSFFINDVPHTQWSLSIPVADGKEYEITYQTPDKEQTTFSHTPATDTTPYETFSGTTVANKTIRIQFTLTPYTNSIFFDPKKTPIDTGDVHRQVKWLINRQQQTPLDFINRIKPAFLSPFTGRVKDPNDPSYPIYANNDPKKGEIFPKADYEYVLDLNETPGITDADGFPTGKVNQVVNNGTTITIPVDKNFELDSAITNSMNNFAPGDRTTITQAGVGQDIIINVPANSGVQRLDKYGQLAPYFIIGKYNVEIPDGTTILTATSGKITIKQTLKDPSVPGGSTVLTAELDPWKEEITGVRVPVVPSKMLINIKGAESDQHLPLGAVQDKILTYFGFKNQTGLPLNGQNKLQITLKMGDGLAVKQIKTPKSNSLLPGTTSYTYTVYYWKDRTPDTGTVAAGSSIPAPTGKLIQRIILTPNYWTPIGGTEDFPEPGNLTVFDQNKDIVDFQAIGDLADTYQNGQPVKAGDGGIKSSITIAITPQGAAEPIEKYREITQTVVDYALVPAELGIWHSQTNKAAGTEKAGYIAINETGGSKQKYIQSPIFYYVLPQNAQVAKNSDGSWDADGFNHDNNEDVTVKPKITVFKVGDRQVVKLDYSETSYKFNTSVATNNLVHLDNVTNAPNGTDYGYIYIVSPTTKIDNTHNPIIDTSKTGSAAYPSDYPSKYPDIFQDAPKDFNPAWVENTSKNVYLVGNFPWEIDQAAATNTPSITAGNKDVSLVQTGKSDDKGRTQMQYAIEIVNNNSNELKNIDQIINLPTAAPNNDSFTFNLTQPISLSSGQSFSYQVKYSDQPVALTTDQNSRPNISSYKDWDEFADKSKIRSAVIIIPSIPANSTLGKFVLNGEDPTVAKDAGKTGTLASGAYIDSLIPFVIDENNHADEAASIKVSGKSTIKFRYHYKDSDGSDHYIDITSASKTYDDNEDTMLSKADAQAIAEANKDLIPAGYRSDLNSDPSKIEVSIINGDKTWQSNADNDKADFGKQVKYYFDSDIVQFELTPNTPTPPAKQDQKAELRFYDDGTGKFITAAPDQTDTGKSDDSISFANGNKQTQDLIKAGYEFVGITKGSDPKSTDFLTKSKYQDADFGKFDSIDDPADKAPSQVFIVHFKHAYKQILKTKTIKETIHYVYEDGSQAEPDYVADSIEFQGTGKKDLVTGKTTAINWQPASYTFASVASPSIPDYTANLAEIAAQIVYADSDNLVFTVVYRKNQTPPPYIPPTKPGGGSDQPSHNPGGKPGNKPGNKPSEKPSSKPGNTPNGKPATPSEPSSVPSNQSKPSPIIKQNHNSVANNTSKASKPRIIKKAQPAQIFQSKHKLPQTGNKTQPLALLGLGLLTLAAIIGLAADRKH